MSAASKCRKTHPCDYRISKFSGGACPQTPLGSKALWALPILCPGVKLSCPPVQNLNEPLSTESRSRYLQMPDCYKLSNGRFDVKHFLPVFYFHVLALNYTDAMYSNYQLYSLGYQSRPCDIFMNLLSSSLPFTYFQ